MSRAAEFNKTLDRLFEDRTYWLRDVIRKPHPGAPPVFGRKKRERAIDNLQRLASEALASKLARTEFTKSVAKKKSWHVRGHGWKEKRDNFNRWFDRHIPYRSVVYAFWNGKRCVYVGKTRGGVGRPSNHFEKVWFPGVSRIDIYALRGRRSLPAVECLAIHRFLPSKNMRRAESRHWTTKCPMCKVHRDIKAEVRAIFGRK